MSEATPMTRVSLAVAQNPGTTKIRVRNSPTAQVAKRFMVAPPFLLSKKVYGQNTGLQFKPHSTIHELNTAER
jgi:hypothetical protein